MHKESELTCWRTPLTDACIVAMTSLQHEGSLTLTFRADFGQAVSLVSFCFRLPSSYKLGSAHSYTEHIARKYTFKQYRRAEISTEGLLFNLKAYSRFADSSYN